MNSLAEMDHLNYRNLCRKYGRLMLEEYDRIIREMLSCESAPSEKERPLPVQPGIQASQ
ncbi:MAG: hypothetical protein AB2L14_19805 [Candidatus Xenobiia bacterium LiM19]